MSFYFSWQNINLCKQMQGVFIMRFVINNLYYKADKQDKYILDL